MKKLINYISNKIDSIRYPNLFYWTESCFICKKRLKYGEYSYKQTLHGKMDYSLEEFKDAVTNYPGKLSEIYKTVYVCKKHDVQ